MSQGKRSDLHNLISMARSGSTSLEQLEAYPASFVRYHKHLRAALRLTQGLVFRDNIQVAVFWGDTRTGKSHRAFDPIRTHGKLGYVKDSTKWWDGYDGQENVIIEEFYYEDVSAALFLRWLDKWPLQGQFKGGYVPCTYNTVVITTNQDPASWYQHHPSYEAVQARLDTIVHFTGNYAAGTLQMDTTKGDLNEIDYFKP